MRRLCAAKGKSLIVTMLDEGKKSIDPKLMKISSVMSERQMVEQNGLYYYRIAATDHIWPSPENIDDFIAFIRTLPIMRGCISTARRAKGVLRFIWHV